MNFLASTSKSIVTNNLSLSTLHNTRCHCSSNMPHFPPLSLLGASLLMSKFFGGHAWLLPGGCAWLLVGGHVWLLWVGAWLLLEGGMCGCSGGWACVVAWGVCMVAWGHAWLLPGGVWLLWGGMHGCLGGCVVVLGGHAWLLLGGAWDTTRYGDTINDRVVRILLECILVSLHVVECLTLSFRM